MLKNNYILKIVFYKDLYVILNYHLYFLITTILISLFCRDKRPAYLGIGITVLAALYQGIINIIGFSTLIVFAAITYIYFNLQLNKVLKTLLFISISVCFTAFAFHKVPGFFNLLAIDKIQLSELSIPFSMYLNFDKVMPALIIFSISDLYILEKQESSGAIKYTLLSLLLCITLMTSLSLMSDYVLFEPKIPTILPIWAINNFFLVCMAEEVFFRGFLQRTLQNLLPNRQILAVIIASLIFGGTFSRRANIYIALSTICGFFYGYIPLVNEKLLIVR